MKATMLFSAALALLSVLPLSAQVIHDQSFKDLSFVKFKVQLLQALLERDTAKLFPLFAEHVHVNEDGCNHAPKSCLMEELRQGGADTDKLWDDMLKAVSYGFSQNVMKEDIYRLAAKGETVFQAPSYRKSFDDKNNQYLLVLGQNVNVREKPTVKSNVVAQASFERLRYIDPMVTGLRSDFHFVNGQQWYEVILADGRRGFIAGDFTSVSVTRELSVKKINGEWRIISFFSPAPRC